VGAMVLRVHLKTKEAKAKAGVETEYWKNTRGNMTSISESFDWHITWRKYDMSFWCNTDRVSKFNHLTSYNNKSPTLAKCRQPQVNNGRVTRESMCNPKYF
jgi:hypothetical protein